jgi:hypothetical protein
MLLYPGTLYRLLFVQINFYKERVTLYRHFLNVNIMNASIRVFWIALRSKFIMVQRTKIFIALNDSMNF